MLDHTKSHSAKCNGLIVIRWNVSQKWCLSRKTCPPTWIFSYRAAPLTKPGPGGGTFRSLTGQPQLHWVIPPHSLARHSPLSPSLVKIHKKRLNHEVEFFQNNSPASSKLARDAGITIANHNVTLTVSNHSGFPTFCYGGILSKSAINIPGVCSLGESSYCCKSSEQCALHPHNEVVRVAWADRPGVRAKHIRCVTTK